MRCSWKCVRSQATDWNGCRSEFEIEVSLRCKTVLLVGGMMDGDVCLLEGMLGRMCVCITTVASL